MLRIEPLNPAAWSEPDWARCYALHRGAHREQGTEARSLAAYRLGHTPAPGARPRHCWVAREAEEIIGKLDLSPSGSIAEPAALGLYVHARCRRRGVARALLREALPVVEQQGVRALQIAVIQPEGWQACERLGGRFEQAGAMRSLLLARASWPVVHAFCDEAARRSPSTRVEAFERLPDALAETFIELYNGAWHDQPLPDFRERLSLELRREQERRYQSLGWRWLTLVVREPGDALSGWTDVLYDPAQPELLHQNVTAILPEHRGRGLAKWLKAAMLLELRQRFPSALRLVTNNAEDNAPMLAINQRLGFGAPIHHRAYSFEVDALLERVGRLA